MGGKSSSSNNAQIEFEKEQAAQAAQKEAERQARLNQGTDAINNIFNSANFNDDFYNKYNQASLDYTLPQLDTQYQQAKRDLTYGLARSGTLRSTAAGDAQNLLETQNLTNEAGLRAQADQQTAALRQNVQGQKQTAINQLYATEDPSIAANTATSMVQQAAISQPNLNPLGALFTPIAVGGASALNSALQNYNINQGIKLANTTGSGSSEINRA